MSNVLIQERGIPLPSFFFSSSSSSVFPPVEEMDITGSQCGSGCESGWTLYLDHSSFSESRWRSFDEQKYGEKGSRFEFKEEDEEDLSMISDASSGPRHYYGDYEGCLEGNGYFFPNPSASQLTKESKSKKKIREIQQHSYLDDTASSPVSLQKNLQNEASVDVFNSAIQNKGKSGIKKNLGFRQTSFSSKPVSREAGNLIS